MIYRTFVKLVTIDDIKFFTTLVKYTGAKCYISQAEYIVDAASVFGILSLDLNKVLCFFTESELPEIFYNKIKKYEIE